MAIMCTKITVNFGKNVENIEFFVDAKNNNSDKMLKFVKSALKEFSIPYLKVSASWEFYAKDIRQLSTKESIIGEIKENADYLRSLSTSPKKQLVIGK